MFSWYTLYSNNCPKYLATSPDNSSLVTGKFGENVYTFPELLEHFKLFIFNKLFHTNVISQTQYFYAPPPSSPIVSNNNENSIIIDFII